MKLHNLSILIPVYNNPLTIAKVVADALIYNLHIVIVDDGSKIPVDTLIDTTTNKNITIITHRENTGKGVALRTGAAKAKDLGYDFCLTMDGDAQHFASDIPAFLDKFTANPYELIIGVRDFDNCEAPKSSIIGRQIGNFWVWVESGWWVNDTQTGFRLYPVDFLVYPSSTTRYEFEIENLVRFIWSGGKIAEVSVKTVYDDTRVTHFDKLKDNLYMIRLHAKLVVMRIFLLKGLFR